MAKFSHFQVTKIGSHSRVCRIKDISLIIILALTEKNILSRQHNQQFTNHSECFKYLHAM